MSWDYDKLFTEGNVVGVKSNNSDTFLTSTADWNNIKFWKSSYGNEKLSNGVGDIRWIVRLDENGEIAERVFDRERDMPKPMPKLKTGMFVQVQTDGMREDDILPALGVVVGDKIIYDNSDSFGGGWDSIDANEVDNVLDDIVAVYSDEARCFCGCVRDRIIWQK